MAKASYSKSADILLQRFSLEEVDEYDFENAPKNLCFTSNTYLNKTNNTEDEGNLDPLYFNIHKSPLPLITEEVKGEDDYLYYNYHLNAMREVRESGYVRYDSSPRLRFNLEEHYAEDAKYGIQKKSRTRKNKTRNSKDKEYLASMNRTTSKSPLPLTTKKAEDEHDDIDDLYDICDYDGITKDCVNPIVLPKPPKKTLKPVVETVQATSNYDDLHLEHDIHLMTEHTKHGYGCFHPSLTEEMKQELAFGELEPCVDPAQAKSKYDDLHLEYDIHLMTEHTKHDYGCFHPRSRKITARMLYKERPRHSLTKWGLDVQRQVLLPTPERIRVNPPLNRRASSLDIFISKLKILFLLFLFILWIVFGGLLLDNPCWNFPGLSLDLIPLFPSLYLGPITCERIPE